MRRLPPLVCLLVLATGCAAEETSGSPASSQKWALGDGEVTQAEYHRAVDRFAKCFTDAGFQVSQRKQSPIDGRTLLFDLLPGRSPVNVEDWNRAVERCSETHLSHIEQQYVESHKHVLDPALRTAVQKCLASKGIRATGTERNATELVARSQKEPLPVLKCIDDSARRVFPGLPADLKILY
ncbi:hypothetical protein ACH4SP_05075 [Streptomyces sp. NPDC021093]|uniref:hypothetical protein n=1 Tax=Streptomyces sp. NPDC021093 TaxID=3365112 RepID=UPI00379E48B9